MAIEREHVQDERVSVQKWQNTHSTHPLSYQENHEDVLGGWKTEGQLALTPGWDK